MANKSQVVIENGKIRIRENLTHPENQARRALREVNEALADLTDNWDGLTQAAKLQAVRRGVILALRAVRWLANR